MRRNKKPTPSYVAMIQEVVPVVSADGEHRRDDETGELAYREVGKPQGVVYIKNNETGEVTYQSLKAAQLILPGGNHSIIPPDEGERLLEEQREQSLAMHTFDFSLYLDEGEEGDEEPPTPKAKPTRSASRTKKTKPSDEEDKGESDEGEEGEKE